MSNDPQLSILAARSLRDRIARGDHQIGILGIEEINTLPGLYKDAAEQGLADAWIDLANWYLAPAIGKPDYKLAEEAFKKAVAANASHAKTKYAAFIWNYKRESTPADIRQQVFNDVATEKDAESLCIRGLFLMAGYGCQESVQEGVKVLIEAAELGAGDAMFELFVCYMQGVGVDYPDPYLGMKYLRKAAEKNHPRATYNLGALYATGRYNCGPSLSESFKWYQKSADAGNAQAFANLGGMYALGQGVEADPDTAEKMLQEAERLGLDVSLVRAQIEEILGHAEDDYEGDEDDYEEDEDDGGSYEDIFDGHYDSAVQALEDGDTEQALMYLDVLVQTVKMCDLPKEVKDAYLTKAKALKKEVTA